MNEAFLCLGGNLGNRIEILNKAIDLISKDCGRIVKISGIYETEAWGSDSKKKFLNIAVRIKTKNTAPQLLKKLLAIEKKLGRKRTEVKNSDRLIDIDILFFNSGIIKTKVMEIPHPRLHLRKFVLKPLMDIDKDMIHPVLNKSIKQLYKNCTDGLKVEAYKPVKYICIEGNIGSGKTTLAIELAKHLNGVFLPEQFEKNDLLPLFYSKPKTYAFPLEYSFLLDRHSQIKSSVNDKTNLTICDFSIYKCLWFARINLNKKDFRFFNKHFKSLAAPLPKPDLIIYLSTSNKNLKQNIISRGREYEKNITSKYLTAVEKQYTKGIEEINMKKKLIISIKKYDQGLNRRLIKKIAEYLN
jgi:deoxyguanosine kinase